MCRTDLSLEGKYYALIKAENPTSGERVLDSFSRILNKFSAKRSPAGFRFFNCLMYFNLLAITVLRKKRTIVGQNDFLGSGLLRLGYKDESGIDKNC